MATSVRSYSKINLGIAIGPGRADGFHALRTIYQTIGLHDVVTVSARLHAGATHISLTTNHPFVPTDARNTAWRMVEGCLLRLGMNAEVELHIDKRLPVQGGIGAGSANAAAALIGLERELDRTLPDAERLALAATVGSDVPLFLIGGAVLGTGRGEIVDPLNDLPEIPCVVATPNIGVSTPEAFRAWDALAAGASRPLTSPAEPVTLEELSQVRSVQPARAAGSLGTSGIVRSSLPNEPVRRQAGNPEKQQGSSDTDQNGMRDDLAENALLALVRTGSGSDLQNDFEAVVFPQYPSLREIKQQLMGSDTAEPASYAALSGSGSALFGLYRSMADARAAQLRVQHAGVPALVTTTLPRSVYWRTMFAESFRP